MKQSIFKELLTLATFMLIYWLGFFSLIFYHQLKNSNSYWYIVPLIIINIAFFYVGVDIAKRLIK